MVSTGKSGNKNVRDGILNAIVGGDPDVGAGLAPFFSLSTASDVIHEIIDESSSIVDVETKQANKDVLGPAPIHNVVKDAVLDTVRGAFTTRDLVHHVKTLIAGLNPAEQTTAATDLTRILTVISGDAVMTELGYGGDPITVNEMLGIATTQEIKINGQLPTKMSPGLSSIIIKPIGISPCTKNTAALTLFMNSVPTIEFAQAVPYVDMTVKLSRPALSDDGRLNAPSVLKFLLGGATVAQGTPDYSMMTATSGSLDDVRGTGTVVGMELFLMPQTVTSISPSGWKDFAALDVPTLRPGPILDPFRPLMSLDTVSIDVAASTGFMSYKTARIEMTVYDRSRIHEVADFIKPDLYSGTEFMLEYGWHHPMTSLDPHDYLRNPWGAMLNAMRVKEKYGIVNSSISIGEAGTAKVTLELAMKGANEYRQTTIGEDIEVQNALKVVNKLQERIGDLRAVLNNRTHNGTKAMKGVLGSQILDSAQTTNGNPALDSKLRKKLDTTVNALRSGPAVANNIADALVELYGTKDVGESSASSRLASALSKSIDKRFRALTDADAGALLDPYMSTASDILQDLGELKHFDNPSTYVSLGKLIMLFVALPLASTLRFDDVQVIFYPFNASAGAAHNRSTSGFLIDKKLFRKEFDAFVLERRSANMSTAEFMNFVTSTFLDNIASPSYGMSAIYTQKKDEADGTVRIAPNKRYKGKDKDLNAATDAEDRLKKMGIASGEFKVPQVDLHLECLPGRLGASTEGSATGIVDDVTILRIHVFDRAATAYETQMQMLAAARDSDLSSITFSETNVDHDEGMQTMRANVYVNAAMKAGLIEGVPGTEASNDSPDGPKYTHYRLVGGAREVKRFVRNTAPNILFGAQNTAITSLSLQTIQDPALSTVNMLRSDRSGHATPEGSNRGGTPLKTVPAELTLELLGCPLLEFMQQFFIDVGTNTDMDSIYAISSLSHTIEPGRFSTSCKMTPLMSYGKYENVISKIESALADFANIK